MGNFNSGIFEIIPIRVSSNAFQQFVPCYFIIGIGSNFVVKNIGKIITFFIFVSSFIVSENIFPYFTVVSLEGGQGDQLTPLEFWKLPWKS